ncbi:7970_t:CDS:2 [Diversispora eburnea]|uniref:7970_t:CDS:1 n=1 Tax=Diversispora eburnea TaxID=1213867 RepID=A0A9N9CB61_9GLOM|nr:7970_t:CDS:2 [Diversispora eburnea]
MSKSSFTRSQRKDVNYGTTLEETDNAKISDSNLTPQITIENRELLLYEPELYGQQIDMEEAETIDLKVQIIQDTFKGLRNNKENEWQVRKHKDK